MKVQIKDLKPNPFRDIEHYPIDGEKIKTLVASIGRTGFWDNILGRLKKGSTLAGWDRGEYVGTFDPNRRPIKISGGGKPTEFTLEKGAIEIAYGHHRLVALKQSMKLTDTVDIPVKALDDATMLKVMAAENMDEWKTSAGVIDETVRATRIFLAEYPEELRKLLVGRRKTTGRSAGIDTISLFLGWDRNRVGDALERLLLIDKRIVDPVAVRSFPTENAAHDFVKAIKQFHPTLAQQRHAAIQIVKEESYGEIAVRGAIADQVYPKKKREREPFKLIELREEIKTAEKLARDLSSSLLTLIRFRREIRDNVYRAEIQALALGFTILVQSLKSFIGEKNHVKQIEG